MPTLQAQRRFLDAVEIELGGSAGSLWDKAFDSVLCDRFVEAEEAGSRRERQAAITGQVEAIQDTLEALAPFTKRLSPVHHRSGGQPLSAAPVQTDSAPYAVPLSDAEQHRSWIFREEMARIANEQYGDRVRWFRDDELGGKPLSVEQAKQWFKSPLARYTNRHILYRTDVTPINTPATELTKSRELRNGSMQDCVTIAIGGHTEQWSKPLRQTTWRFTLPDGEQFEYWESSLVAELVERGARLARFLPWTAAGAAWFILTGTAPDVPPVIGTFTRTTQHREWQRGVLKIEIEPWVSEKTLLALYRDVRRRVNPETRKLPARALAVWQFAQDQQSASFVKVGFAECWRRWNSTHPERQYADYRQFTRDAKRGKRHAEAMTSITYPGYRMLNRTDNC